MVGVNFFLTCSPILDLGHFSQVILPIVLLIMPQLSGDVHSTWWLGLIFFYLFSHSGLRAFFTDDFANCTTVYAQPSGAVHSIWWLGLIFFDLFSHSGLRAFFTNDFANCTTNYAPTKNNPNHQVLWTASDGWGFFFLTCSPILDLGHFSQVILPIVLLIMPQLSGAVHSIWWLGLFFFDLFSHSGLRAFFTSDFANCTTNYASPQK